MDWVEHDPHVHDLDATLHIDKSEHPWPEPYVLRRCAIAWGVVYGISRLAALDQIPASVPGDAREHIRQALAALYSGWQAGA